MAQNTSIFHAEKEVKAVQKLILGLAPSATDADVQAAMAKAQPGQAGHGMKLGQWDADLNDAFTRWVIQRQQQYGAKVDGWVGEETLGALKANDKEAFEAVDAIHRAGLNRLHSRTTLHPPKGETIKSEQREDPTGPAASSQASKASPVQAQSQAAKPPENAAPTAPSSSVAKNGTQPTASAPSQEDNNATIAAVAAVGAIGATSLAVTKAFNAARFTRETSTVSELRQNLRNDAAGRPSAAQPATGAAPARPGAPSEPVRTGEVVARQAPTSSRIKDITGTVETTGPERPVSRAPVSEPITARPSPVLAAAEGAALEGGKGASFLKRGFNWVAESPVMKRLGVAGLLATPTLAAAEAPEGKGIDAAMKEIGNVDYAIGAGMLVPYIAPVATTLMVARVVGSDDYETEKKELAQTLAPDQKKQVDIVSEIGLRTPDFTTQLAVLAGSGPLGATQAQSEIKAAELMRNDPGLRDKVRAHYTVMEKEATDRGDPEAAGGASWALAGLNHFDTTEAARLQTREDFKNARDPHRAMAAQPVPVF